MSEGFDSVFRRFKAVRNNAPRVAVRATNETAAKLAQEIRETLPVNSGDMRRRTTAAGNEVTIDDPGAAPLELGTSNQPANPVARKAVRRLRLNQTINKAGSDLTDA